MFKIGSFESEIMQSMEKNLISNQIDNRYGFNKLARATDLLNMAAEIFDKSGMHEEANDVSKILSNLIEKIK